MYTQHKAYKTVAIKIIVVDVENYEIGDIVDAGIIQIKLVNYIKLEEKKMSGWGKLGKLFIDEDSMAEFMNRYLDMYETDIEDIDLFGWDAVADDIEYAINNYGAYKNIGDFVEVEISRNNTKNGNPELITVGEVVESPNYDSETDQWYGDYKLKN